MGKWREVVYCDNCAKIYTDGVPRICKRCGEVLTKSNPVLDLLYGGRKAIPINVTKAIARKRLFWWEFKQTPIKESEDDTNDT